MTVVWRDGRSSTVLQEDKEAASRTARAGKAVIVHAGLLRLVQRDQTGGFIDRVLLCMQEVAAHLEKTPRTSRILCPWQTYQCSGCFDVPVGAPPSLNPQ